MMPSVTVVITAWRRERFWPEAVRSALDQTQKPDEIVVVKTAGPIPLWVFTENVKVITVPESLSIGGMYKLVMDSSKGAIVAFLDDDDRFGPTKVATVCRVFGDNPRLAGYHNERNIIDAGGNPSGWPWPRRPPLSESVILDPFADGAINLWREGLAGTPWCNLSCMSLRRAAIDRVADILPQLESTTDWFFLLAALQHGAVMFSTNILTDYRVHDSTSHSRSGERRTMDDVRFARSFLPLTRYLRGSPLSAQIADDMHDDWCITEAQTSGRMPTLREWVRYAAFVGHHIEPYRFKIGLNILLNALRSRINGGGS